MASHRPTSDRPLWHWTLLAIAPGLLSAVLGTIAMDADSEDLTLLVLGISWFVPPLGFLHVLVVGNRYRKAGLAESSVGFVIGHVLLNTFLWGAGCAMLLR